MALFFLFAFLPFALLFVIVVVAVILAIDGRPNRKKPQVDATVPPIANPQEESKNF